MVMITNDFLPDVLKPLARLLDQPKPNILIVVGTGISVGATGDPRASWKGLLLNAVNRIENLGIEKPEVTTANRILIEEAFTGEFNLDEILQRAESIVRRLGGVGDQRFASWLQDSVGALKPARTQRQSLDAIADLARAGTLILTTNYDSLLSDATGFDPVTWEEPGEILKVLNRQRKGIIHIHGHWSRPSSVVLGRTSYDRIRSTVLPQTELRSLWLLWHWVYLGCGSGGLDDPNLGALLQWARDAGLGDSALSDYFLSTSETIELLPDRIGKSGNLVKWAYSDHTVDLPVLLRQLAPEARASPFQRIGPHARRVRRPDESPLLSPFPSWQEYLNGAVPSFAADDEVVQRLDKHGWALVLDVASVGKSTLAYRVAARPEYRTIPAYYLLLSQLTVDEAESDISPQAALARLARPGVLLVIDDAHQRAELAYTLWHQWHERPIDSKLLIVATRTEKSINLPGDSSLRDLETHPLNPAVALRPTAEDLEPIANYVMARLAELGPNDLGLTPDTLNKWHQSFGRELGAFVVAISQRRRELLRGDFTLPESAGATWMKERHLENLESRDIENAVCLAVFGDQALELDVPEHCLPHPTRTNVLLKSGLAERITIKGRAIQYSLREPGWGQLILAALERSPSQLPTIIDPATKDIAFALAIAQRLAQSETRQKLESYWKELAAFLTTHENQLSKLAFQTPLHVVVAFVNAAQQLHHDDLATALLGVLATQPELLANQAFESTLNALATLLDVAGATGQKLLVERLCGAIAAEPVRLAEQVIESTFNDLAAFLDAVGEQGQQTLIEILCGLIAEQEDRLLERVFSDPLQEFGALMATLKKLHKKKLVDRFWHAIAEHPRRFAEHASKQLPYYLIGFLASVPAPQKKQLIEHFKIEAWTHDGYQPKSFVGAAGLAGQFGLNGREDLKIVLVDNILRRKNAADFGDRRTALTEISRLASFVAPDQQYSLIELVKAICTESWLAGAYRFGSIVGLAGALHMISVHQPPNVIRLFWHQALRARLSRELSKLALLNDQELNAAIQLLGVSQLSGWRIGRSALGSAPLGRIGQLPNVIRHRPEASIVEQFQRQLWFGLRVIAAVGPGTLHVDPEIIFETLSLWQKNIDGVDDWVGTKQSPESTAHRINDSMVTWLRSCLHTQTGQLLPNQEPLWVLAGFPRNLEHLFDRR